MFYGKGRNETDSMSRFVAAILFPLSCCSRPVDQTTKVHTIHTHTCALHIPLNSLILNANHKLFKVNKLFLVVVSHYKINERLTYTK